MRRVLAAYQAMLAKQPFLTQVAQTSLIMGVGDFIAQKFLEKKPFSQYEISRTLGFCFVGATVVAPWLTVWYRTLHRIVKPSKFAPLKNAHGSDIDGPEFHLRHCNIPEFSNR
ncbi:protein sym-1-like [Ctenocephalides felis]|uniref:protein sym-1-like n=1 Tax=Ctenocephalides felis TaxID=7515 RepID=UPI000E6E1A59|nr:protein sym-1-like [Ctenocephalides felis]